MKYIVALLPCTKHQNNKQTTKCKKQMCNSYIMKQFELKFNIDLTAKKIICRPELSKNRW